MIPIVKWEHLEQEIVNWANDAVRHRNMLYERITDSKAAGNLISNKPADFYFLHEGRFTYLEAKFSKKHRTLRSCFAKAVRPSQIASAYLANRAGGYYRFLFYSSVTELFEVWEGVHCYEMKKAGKALSIVEGRILETVSLKAALKRALGIDQ